MEFNIYKLCLASSFSLFCLLVPKAATAQNLFLSVNDLSSEYQKNTGNSVTLITEKLKIDSTISATDISKTTNSPNQNVTITNSRDVEIDFSQSQDRAGLAAKGGKKPPRKG